jgi:hypothetical protein
MLKCARAPGELPATGQPVILCVWPDPKPHYVRIVLYCEGSVMQTNPN